MAKKIIVSLLALAIVGGGVFSYFFFLHDNTPASEPEPIPRLFLDSETEPEIEPDPTPKLTPKPNPDTMELTDTDSIEAYLIAKFGTSFETPYGTQEIVYVVEKNDDLDNAHDYSIQLFMWITYGLDAISDRGKIDDTLRKRADEAHAAYRDFIKKIGTDLIKKIPEKKLEGCYNYFNEFLYYSWSNIKGNSVLAKYNETSATKEFFWYGSEDDGNYARIDEPQMNLFRNKGRG